MATISDSVNLPHLPTSPTLSTSSLSSISTTSFPRTPKYSTYAVFKTTPIDTDSDGYYDDDNDTLTTMTPRYTNKSNFMKSITALYSKEKSPQSNKDRLTSAAKFLKDLQSNDLSPPNLQSLESQADHDVLSHQHSLEVLDNHKSLLPEFTTSTPKRKRKMTDLFMRLSSSAVSTKNKTDRKTNTGSASSFLPDTQIPILTCETLRFRKHQHSLNKSISTPVLNSNRSTSSSSSLPSYGPPQLPRKSSKRVLSDLPTNLKIHSMQPFENLAFVDDKTNAKKPSKKLSNILTTKTSQSSVPLKAISTTQSKSINTLESSISSPLLSSQSPKPTRRQRSTSLLSTTGCSVKATFRMKSHNCSQTSISSMTPSTSSTSSLRPSDKVEQLKTKINKLQQGLKPEKHERKPSSSHIKRIEYLEDEVSRERSEQMQLLAKHRLYKNHHNKSESQITSTGSASGLPSTFSSDHDEDTRLENCDSAMERRVPCLESQFSQRNTELKTPKRIMIQEKSISEHEILNGQRCITGVKLSLERFKTEDDTLNNNFSKTETTTKQADKQLSRRQSKPKYSASRVAKLENTIDHLNKDFSTKIENKNIEIKDLTTLLAQYKSKSRQLNDKVKRLTVENQVLQERSQTLEIEHNEMAKAACGYQKQVTAVDREFRRAILYITSLETSLQDLKISLEEKALENDELNRSIQRVMEQANDTIEGTKRRHSLRNGNES